MIRKHQRKPILMCLSFQNFISTIFHLSDKSEITQNYLKFTGVVNLQQLLQMIQIFLMKQSQEKKQFFAKHSGF
jgi:hypothetical protein